MANKVQDPWHILVFLWLTHHKVKQKTVSVVIQAKDGRQVAISKCVINLSNNNVSKIYAVQTHTINLSTKEAQVEDLFSGLCVLPFSFFFV
jgi:hypothetical protein